MERPPRVSILMAVHNGLPYVRETLDDLLRQTLPDFELIVVDDASEDGTLKVLHTYAAEDARIRVVTNEKNLKLAASLNRGLSFCSAPLTARADGDDRYPPHRLERQVEFMDRHPEVGLLSCAVHKINQDGVRFSTTHFPTEDGPIRLRELFVNSFSHPGAIFRTELVKQLGGYNPYYFAGEDADLWARIRSRAEAANLSEPLVYYRVLRGSMMRTRSAEGRDRSLSVRQRSLSDYLKRTLTLEETRQLVRVFHALRHDPPSLNDLAVARRGFGEVLGKARRRESPQTVAYFREEVASAYLRHYRFSTDRKDGPMVRCLLEALRWNPKLLLSGYVARETGKATLPSVLVTWIRRFRARQRREDDQLPNDP